MNFYKKYVRQFIPTSRIYSVTRISLDMELKRQFARLSPGIVLDAGSRDSPYRRFIPHTKYLRLDIDKRSEPDICCDLHNIDWEADYFDTVIMTEVLEHLYDPQKAIDNIHRILKPNGVCILSTRFMFPYHPDPKDYYRFTQDSLSYLFRNFRRTEIHHHGNRVQVMWQTINIGKVNAFLNVLNPLFARIMSKKTNFPSGFIVYAEK